MIKSSGFILFLPLFCVATGDENRHLFAMHNDTEMPQGVKYRSKYCVMHFANSWSPRRHVIVRVSLRCSDLPAQVRLRASQRELGHHGSALR